MIAIEDSIKLSRVLYVTAATKTVMLKAEIHEYIDIRKSRVRD